MQKTSDNTSFDIWTVGQWYYNVRGLTERNDSKAPRLNFIKCVLFDVVPSGKISSGDLFERRSSTST